MPILKLLYGGGGKREPWSQFARDMVLEMKVRYLTIGESINKQGSVNKQESPVLALITRGIVTAFNQVNYYEKHFKEWEYLGQREFFMGGPTLNQTVCRTFTRIYCYHRDDFLRVIKRHPLQNEIFMSYY